jgi:murein DD-endopeptidase MepM/ murein hydrolase activator NlpD
MALALVMGASIIAPASADTKSELDAAKRDYEAARARLQSATAKWQRAQSRLETLKDDIAETRQRIAEHTSAIRTIERGLQRRAILAFQAGPASTIDVLLSSASITELSDRLEFLDSVAQGDADLVTALQVEEQRLAWDREALADAIEEQSTVTEDYQEARAEIAARTAELREIFEDLERRYRQEQRSLIVLGQTIGTGFIERCPVAGPNSFVDSFGWPRSGGRTHEGIDLIAATGTPVVAAHSGVVTHSSSSLGGIQAYVRASSGSETFYAHLNAYSDASGSVSAGTVIGYVGSTGNAGTPHLHFELHPGGGGAVNPYSALVQVC